VHWKFETLTKLDSACLKTKTISSKRTVTSACKPSEAKNYHFCLELFQAKELSLPLATVSSKRIGTSACNHFKEQNSQQLCLQCPQITYVHFSMALVIILMGAVHKLLLHYMTANVEKCIHTHTNLTRNHCLWKQLQQGSTRVVWPEF